MYVFLQNKTLVPYRKLLKKDLVQKHSYHMCKAGTVYCR